MRGKLMFLGGLALGYVLGAREGRERYNQLVDAARRILDHPTVQEARGVVQAQANRIIAEGKTAVSDKLGHTRMGQRLMSSSSGNAMNAPSSPQPSSPSQIDAITPD